MKLMIDANVLLDVLMKRELFYKDSLYIWKLAESKVVTCYVSTLTFANIVYVLRKKMTASEIDELFRYLSIIFNFADLTSQDLNNACSLRWKDYEDSIQYIIAKRLGVDALITRNKKDFICDDIKVIEPNELVL